MALEEGTETKLLKKLTKVNVRVFDDFGLVALGVQKRHWLLEVAEERHHKPAAGKRLLRVHR